MKRRPNSIAVSFSKSNFLGVISEPYKNFKDSLCEAVLPGIVELMAISMLIGFLNLLNSIFGVCFVIRNKIDVPKASGRRSSQSMVSPDLRRSITGRKKSKSEKVVKKASLAFNINNSMYGKGGEKLLGDLDQSGNEDTSQGQISSNQAGSHP